MSEDKIKFYKEYTLNEGYYSQDIIKYIQNFDDTNFELQLDNIIELYNVSKYLNLDTSKANDDNTITSFKQKSHQILGNYFSNISLSEIVYEYKDLYSLYLDDFWTIFVDYKLIKKTSVSEMESFIKANDVPIIYLLNKKNICDKYNSIIKVSLLNNPKYFELFITKYDSVSKVDYHLPNNISDSEINTWARRYCELETANTNYLLKLGNWSNKNEKKIDDIILVKAKKAYKDITNTMFNNKNSPFWTIEIGFKSDIKNICEISSSHQIFFNKDWLDKEQDYPTILNNFLYFFSFFKYNNQLALLSSPYSSGNILDTFRNGSKSKHGYNISADFEIKRTLYGIVFLAYFDYLSSNNIDLEQIFSYYFKEHLKAEYKNENFFFSNSSIENSYYERSKALMPEMDSILKQFDLYQKYGKVDPDLFEISSKITSYSQIKSLETKKFIYFKSNEIKNLCYLLFDKKSSLAFTEHKKGQTSFYDYVQSGINLTDFYKYQKIIIKDSLIDKKIIKCTLTNKINFTNDKLISLYKQIWDSGYLSILFLSNDYIQLIDSEVYTKNLKYGNTLFSEQESDYISFVMDNKKYNNGLAIRNKMTHGSFAKKNKQDHKEFYLELMMILLLYTVRINEEIDYQDQKNISVNH